MNEEESILQRAVRWAAKRHRGQDRDGRAPLPYISHPIDVMNRLRYVGGIEDEAVLAAAALHDLVEECGVPFEEIEARFGGEVVELVREMTRHEPSPEELAGLSEEEIWELRSRTLLEEIGRMSPPAKVIKLADRASNLTSARVTRSGEKLARYIRQSYLILEVIPRDANPPLWDSIKAMLN